MLIFIYHFKARASADEVRTVSDGRELWRPRGCDSKSLQSVKKQIKPVGRAHSLLDAERKV